MSTEDPEGAGPASLAIRDAAQVLRPPRDGLAYLRADRARELTLEPGGLTAHAGRITALGAEGDAEVTLDASGCAVIPGFVDAHTHLPFVGWRAEEYAEKVAGASYADIAARGGGIVASARALAEASDDDVLAQSQCLAAEMLAWGTTAFECKSGYGLSVAGELRALDLARRLGGAVAQTTVSTALLAHAVPDGGDADGWMSEVEALAPQLARRPTVRALDIYVESFAFSQAHLRRMGALAARLGIALRCHVEQFATQRSVPVALELGARSVDHLSCLHPDDIAPLAGAECAAVLLPGAELMGAEHPAPGRALADAGAILVLASDANPGTSPIVAMPLIVGLGVRRYGLSVREALLATTLNAAWALGLSGEVGSLEVGKRADVLVLDGALEHVPYRFGHHPVAAAVVGGRPAYVRPDQAWRVSGGG